jgi:hypothetical protein
MNNTLSKIMTMIGVILILPSILFWGIWIKSFYAGSNQSERVSVLISHFPEGTTVGILTSIAIISSLGAALASVRGLRGASSIFRVANITVIVLASLLTFLNIFQLL